MTPAARTTDPETSRQAAKQVTRLRASQAIVLNVFVAYGDMCDKDLLDRVHATQRGLGLSKVMSPSGVRSRRSELSKPNMDRLDQIKSGMGFGDPLSEDVVETNETFELEARRRLRMEGFRSRLWDTGKREIIDGRSVIVWGLAK